MTGGRMETCLVCGRRFPETEGRCAVCISALPAPPKTVWRVLVTGSRTWTDTHTIIDALNTHAAAYDTLVVGDCRPAQTGSPQTGGASSAGTSRST